MPEKRFRQVCKCEKCGNEAEMQVTCTLEPEEEAVKIAEDNRPAPAESPKKTVSGEAVCSHCGNEADMWIEVE